MVAASLDPVPVSPTKCTLSQDEFVPGCIISINGYDMDYGKYQVRNHTPSFYGTVVDLTNIDLEQKGDLADDELIVRFVVSGEYEWYNKNVPNVLRNNYSKSVHNTCCFPPTDFVDVESYDDDGFTKWFAKTRTGCVV